MDIEIEVNEGYLKPSQIYEPAKPLIDFATPTIFQTPPLPCFEEQKLQYLPKEDPLEEMVQYRYDSNGDLITENYTGLAKEGVWKIGKLKVVGNEMTVTIAGIQMRGRLSNGEGKAVVIDETHLFDLGNWSGMWIVEPTDELFSETNG